MTIAFYINNSQFPDLDCSGLQEGNPGIGGTWYEFLLISQQLAERNNGIDVVQDLAKAIDYYKKAGLYTEIDGRQPIDAVTEDLVSVLSSVN